MKARSLITLLAAALTGAALLAACAPGAAVLSPPTFRLNAADSGFIRIDPPGVGDGSALFRLALTVENPNPVGVRLAGLDGDLYLRDARAASSSFRGGIDLPARATAPLVLDVKVPLGAAPILLDVIANFVAGNPIQYRFDAAVTIDVLGAPQRFPAFTLARGELSRPAGLAAPQFVLTGTELRFEAVDRVRLSLRAELTNPGLIGYLAEVPQATLSVGGAAAATVALAPVQVPGGGTVPVAIEFTFAPLSLGAAIAAQVQAASVGVGGLSLQVNGAWRLDAPGIATTTLGATTILRDALR